MYQTRKIRFNGIATCGRCRPYITMYAGDVRPRDSCNRPFKRKLSTHHWNGRLENDIRGTSQTVKEPTRERSGVWKQCCVTDVRSHSHTYKKRILNHKWSCVCMKRLINRALMPLSLASDLRLNPNAMTTDNDNRNMKVLLWNTVECRRCKGYV